MDVPCIDCSVPLQDLEVVLDQVSLIANRSVVAESGLRVGFGLVSGVGHVLIAIVAVLALAFCGGSRGLGCIDWRRLGLGLGLRLRLRCICNLICKTVDVGIEIAVGGLLHDRDSFGIGWRGHGCGLLRVADATLLLLLPFRRCGWIAEVGVGGAL